MLGKNRLLRIGSTAAAVGVLLLVSMLFVTLPEGMSYPGVEALNGDLALSPTSLAAYAHSMQLLFALDGLFLVCWFISWVGIAQIVLSRSQLLGVLMLVTGLGGAVLDLAENSIIWSGLLSLQAGHFLSQDWVVAWKVVQHLSYILPMIGAVFAGCGLWGDSWWDRLASLAGTFFVSVAVVGLYLPELSFLADAWYLLWFASASILLWQHSRLFKVINHDVSLPDR